MLYIHVISEHFLAVETKFINVCWKVEYVKILSFYQINGVLF